MIIKIHFFVNASECKMSRIYMCVCELVTYEYTITAVMSCVHETWFCKMYTDATEYEMTKHAVCIYTCLCTFYYTHVQGTPSFCCYNYCVDLWTLTLPIIVPPHFARTNSYFPFFPFFPPFGGFPFPPDDVPFCFWAALFAAFNAANCSPYSAGKGPTL